jgi:Na+/H+-translocating membrane pyrophosphatase
MTSEILARQVHDGLPNDHPRNPSVIMQNIAKGFLCSIQSCLEANAMTNMGLCLFQDFFVIKYVYVYDRGYLNSIAIFTVSLLCSLISMLIFRK